MEYEDVTTMIFALQKAILYETHISPNSMTEINGHEKEHLEGYQNMRAKLYNVIESYNNKYPEVIIDKGVYLEWEPVDEDTGNDNGKGRKRSVAEKERKNDVRKTVDSMDDYGDD